MIGIGGVSMSGIALILHSWKIAVIGSDKNHSLYTQELEEHGIPVYYNQVKENITKDLDLVVYTAAIPKNHEELMQAKELEIQTMERGEFLGELTKLFPKTIGIAGTHGKTTTTAMISKMFVDSSLDPSIQVGAHLDFLNGNYRVGKSPYFIIEACEYCDSFLNFEIESAIVLNIDNDHLDYFKNIENTVKSFQKYISKVKKEGVLILNKDDKYYEELRKNTTANVITIGEYDADYCYKNIRYDNHGYPTYDLYYKGEFLSSITLSVLGVHNILNSLASIALARYYGIDIQQIQESLKTFYGASRRMEYKGMFQGARVYDDYGHHPTEVEAVAKSIHEMPHKKSYVIFEPHTYSRLSVHLDAFAKALSLFDNIIIYKIYAAREQNTYQIEESHLQEKLSLLGKDSTVIKDFNEIINYLKPRVQEEDLIITLGAGEITKLSSLLTKEEEK